MHYIMVSDHKEQDDHHEHEGEDESKLQKFIKTIISLGHSHDENHDHTFVENTEEGIKAVKLSFIGLMITAVFQVIIVAFTGSVALLADTVHNFSDAFTSIPLWLAFRLSKREKSDKFSYGYGRAEDLAGLFIVVMIAGSAGLVFWESFNRLLNPQPVRNLAILTAAAIIGFIGNEVVAQYRIRKGREINSEALIADGLHSRTDGLTSLSILVGVAGSAIGYPIIDPIIGLIIGVLILYILRDATQSILLRLLDGVNPNLIEKIDETIKEVSSVKGVHGTKARFSGRFFYAETHINLDKNMTIKEAHEISEKIEKHLQNNFENIGTINIHIDPS